MRLDFHGGARTVTGSCFILHTDSMNLMIDCGLFQGEEASCPKCFEGDCNAEPFGFDPAMVDMVILTHAHIDHSGRIPLLFKRGFTGTVLATRATVDLARIMLLDCAHILGIEAEWKSRKRLRSGLDPVEPLYGPSDVERALRNFRGIGYGEKHELGPGVWCRLYDAGHIMGSAIVELEVAENGHTEKIVFSGDLGTSGHPIIRDPETVSGGRYVVMESTYGSRLHDSPQEVKKMLAQIINRVVRDGGNLIIPAFAVGRTQEILYYMRELRRSGDIPSVPVYVDSPLAISATEIFQRHAECFDGETMELLKKGIDPFSFEGLQFVRLAEESRRLNGVSGSVIISASGMCEAGRVRHHLRHNLWRKESAVLFVGFQAMGTLGRRIKDGEKEVRIFGEDIAVRAEIKSIDALSSHADKNGLTEWVSAMQEVPSTVVLVHGEADSFDQLGDEITHRVGCQVVVPECGDCLELRDGMVTNLDEAVVARAARALRSADAGRSSVLEHWKEVVEDHRKLERLVEKEISSPGGSSRLKPFVESIRQAYRESLRSLGS